MPLPPSRPERAPPRRLLGAVCWLLLVAFGACDVPKFEVGMGAGGSAGASDPVTDAASDAAGGASSDASVGAAGSDGATDAGSDACVGVSCQTEPCPAGFGDCNGERGDGCETPLDSRDDCGSCGNGCSNQHGLTACAGSSAAGWACTPTCVPGFADCDLNAGNGCETDINTDSTHCGSCDFACPANGGTPLCQGKRCGVSSCNPGFGDCSNVGTCNIKLSSDPNHCGQCGHVCSSAHGKSTCNAGVCQIACDAGYGDCNQTTADGGRPPDDGCETKLNVPDSNGNVANCGACGASCARRGFTTVNLQQCALGECARDCFAGQGDCDNNRNAAGCTGSTCGCERGLVSDANSCGACGHVCKGGACVNSVCQCPDTQPRSGASCTLASSVKCGTYGASCSCICTSGSFKCTDSSGKAC